MKNSLLAVVLATALFFSGCAGRVNHITNLPPGVSEQSVKSWYDAVGAFSTIKNESNQVLTAVVALHANGEVPDAIYEKILRGIGRLDQAQIDADNFLKSVPNDWSQSTQVKIKSYANIVSAELQAIVAQGLVGIKNPTAVKNINNLIILGTQAVDVVLSLIQ